MTLGGMEESLGRKKGIHVAQRRVLEPALRKHTEPALRKHTSRTDQ